MNSLVAKVPVFAVRLLLLPAFSILSCCRFAAQTYTPLPASGCIWTMADTDYTIYKAGGDTAINGILWNKALVSHDTLMSPGSFQYIGCYRNDTAAKRVYCIRPGETTERLMYDFSMEKGDTASIFMLVPLFGSTGEKTVVAGKVDTVVAGGTSRRRIWLSYGAMYPGYQFEWWLEGTGSLFGPFSPVGELIFDAIYPIIICQINDSVVVYPYPHFNKCSPQLITGFDKFSRQSGWSVYPTVTGETLRVSFSAIGPHKLAVINSMGQVLWQSQHAGGGALTIDVSRFSPGVYSLCVTGSNGGRAVRFVKSSD